MAYFPNIDPRALAALGSLKSLLETDPNYLKDPECPYDDLLKAELEKLLEPKIVEIPIEKIVERIVEKRVEVAAAAADGAGKRGPRDKASSGNADAIAKELEDIQKDIRQLKTDSKVLMPADKVQVIKTRTVLVEKMITLEERKTNIKKVSLFMSTVMGILDDLIPEEHRQLFMKRLEPFVSEE